MPPKRGTTPAEAAAFEYCELCRRNHDQGRRHRYFPAHRAALAAALSRFRSKLADLRRGLRHPSSSSAAAAAPRSRLWCPFCSADLVDLDSRFACSNVFYHLASQDHLNGVKSFLRKHGGDMGQVDSFRISEDELAKWEKSCESLITEPQTPTEGIPYSAPFETFGVPVTPCGLVVSHEKQAMKGTHSFCSADTKMKGSQSTILGNGPNSSGSSSVYVQQRNPGGNFSQGLKANVHTGAPPPWLQASEHDQENVSLNGYARQSSQKGKSGRLNPKRVGAAWAERRRAEMEMEKRGELVPETSDSSWLPNFGSVWQSGTRKESRKEFEKKHTPHDEKSNKLSLEVKPYISKRMPLNQQSLAHSAVLRREQSIADSLEDGLERER
uniref:TITAN-like protein n=1 Tax=Leersia perrieri TaxID=77586 RepID=A0A0D9XFF0_9ORYZ